MEVKLVQGVIFEHTLVQLLHVQVIFKLNGLDGVQLLLLLERRRKSA